MKPSSHLALTAILLSAIAGTKFRILMEMHVTLTTFDQFNWTVSTILGALATLWLVARAASKDGL